MTPRIPFSLIVAIALLAFANPTARCDERGRSITASIRADDSRLERKISIASDRISLGELLDRVSLLSGVSLRVNERDSLSGIPILVVIKDAPLADVMNSLWSLLSYSGASWRWAVEGSKNRYIYSFEPSFATHQLTSRLKAEAQQLFEMHAQTMLRIAQLDNGERKKHVKEISASLLQANNEIAESWIGSDLIWEGLSTFVKSASPEIQGQVLRGESRLTLPISNMSDADRTFVRHYMDQRQSQTLNPDGTLTRRPEPENITILAETEGRITPTLYIALNGGGLSFLGGNKLETGVADRMGKRWLLPGDSETKVTEALSIEGPFSPEEPRSEMENGAKRPITRAVRQLAAGAPLSLMALLPDEQPVDPGPPHKITVKAYLDKLHVYTKVVKKWHGNILLLSSPLRFMTDDVNIPYKLIRRLTKTGVHNSDFLSLAELADIPAQLSMDQLAKASKQYAVVYATVRLAPILAFFLSDRDFGRTSGVVMTSELQTILRQAVKFPPDHAVITGQALRLRLAVEDDVMGNVPIRRVRVQYQNSDRKWVAIPGAGFMQMGTPPPIGIK